MPDGFVVNRMRVEYKNPAVLGDDIVMKCANEENRLVVELLDKDDKVFVIAEFRGEA